MQEVGARHPRRGTPWCDKEHDGERISPSPGNSLGGGEGEWLYLSLTILLGSSKGELASLGT